MPRYDLRTPCRNCPFVNDDTRRIRFRCRERAEEIEESAYRNGFPCHLSANLIEDDEYEADGYVFGPNTQHCAGYILMQLHECGGSPWPGIGNDEDLLQRLAERMDWDAPVFTTTEAFLTANEDPAHAGREPSAKPNDPRR